MNLNSKVIVITGAGSGIGRALAQLLAARGARLALSDINTAGLTETLTLLESNVDVKSYTVDVSDRVAVENNAADVVRDFGHVDVVINNAGVSSRSTIEECKYDDFEWVMNIVMWGVVYGSKAYLPHLQQRPEASLVNISSINAFFPFYANGPYNMAKAAVQSLNDTLFMELKNSNVQVTSVHPGGIKTNIAKSARNSNEGMSDRFDKIASTTSEQCAEQIIRGIEKRKAYVYVGKDAYFTQFIRRISRPLALALSARLSAKIA